MGACVMLVKANVSSVLAVYPVFARDFGMDEPAVVAILALGPVATSLFLLWEIAIGIEQKGSCTIFLTK